MYDGYHHRDQYGGLVPPDLVTLTFSETEAQLLEEADLTEIIGSKWYEIEMCLFISNKVLPDYVEDNPNPKVYFRDNKIRKVNRVDDVLKRWSFVTPEETDALVFYHA